MNSLETMLQGVRQEEARMREPNPNPAMPDPPKVQEKPQPSAIEKLEAALRERWDFRFNDIKLRPEWRKKGQGEYIPMDDYTLNSMTRALKIAKVKGATRAQIAVIINSEFAPKVDPICGYFAGLEDPGSDDHIQALCDTVTPLAGADEEEQKKAAAMFRKFFEKWLVGAVANTFDKKMCRNHICFILTGKQGTFKSTWIRQLCPAALQDYYFEGNLDPENKDDLFATAENFLYNMDDYFAAVTSKKINEFKSFLTKNSVKGRAAYGRYAQERPKICSFIASSNEGNFLHDPTGNRRFVPFEVSAIDIDAAKKIDINLVWAQAYKMYRSGFEYWLNKADQDELQEHNSQYEVQSAEYEALITYFQTPADRERADAYLQSTKIRKKLEDEFNMKFSPKRMGEALTKAGFERFQKRVNGSRLWVYAVQFVEAIDIQSEDEKRGDEEAEAATEGTKEDLPF